MRLNTNEGRVTDAVNHMQFFHGKQLSTKTMYVTLKLIKSHIIFTHDGRRFAVNLKLTSWKRELVLNWVKIPGRPSYTGLRCFQINLIIDVVDDAQCLGRPTQGAIAVKVHFHLNIIIS
jgi:hypothetical protein